MLLFLRPGKAVPLATRPAPSPAPVPDIQPSPPRPSLGAAKPNLSHALAYLASNLICNNRWPAPAYDFVSTPPYLPEHRLALTFGGTRDMTAITVDQLLRFVDHAGLPFKPVARIVNQTAEATLAAWGKLAAIDILPVEIFCAVDEQVEREAGRVLKQSLT